MWSFDPGRVLTSDGRLQLYSVDEWLMESQLADGPASGVGPCIRLHVGSQRHGEPSAVTGDAGVSPVRCDALGRMVSFRAPDGVGWSVRYDARARPTAVNDGDVDALWLWAPDADPAGGVSGLLASGVEAAVPWVFSEGGMAVRRNAMNIEGIVADGRGKSRLDARRRGRSRCSLTRPRVCLARWRRTSWALADDCSGSLEVRSRLDPWPSIRSAVSAQTA